MIVNARNLLVWASAPRRIQLRRYWELLRFFVSSYLKTRYENLVLGYLWWLINPMLWIGVYWLLVSVIFNRGTPKYPLFVACAILPWRSFAISLSQSVTSISRRERLIKQVSFPKYVIPTSIVLANGVNVLFSGIVLLGLAIIYGIHPTVHILWFFPIMAVQMTLTLGLSLILSVLGVYFIDTGNVLEFVLRLWLYLSPSLYDIDRIPQRLHFLLAVNPFVGIFSGYRNAFMYGKPPDMSYMMSSVIIATSSLILGIFVFKRFEHEFTKMV